MQKYCISNIETRLLGLATQDPVHLGNGVTGQVSLMASESVLDFFFIGAATSREVLLHEVSA